MRVTHFAELAGADLASAASALRAADVQPEGLAEYIAERRVMLVRRPATMRPIGEVWRLGTLLLGAADGEPALFAAGHTTRAAVRLHPGNQSISREERRDIAAAALRGGYPEGAAVNFDAIPIALAALDDAAGVDPSLPLGVAEGPGGPAVRVRWRAGAPLENAQTLAAYLQERVGLLIDPPQQST